MSNTPSDENVGIDLSVNTEQAARNIQELQQTAEQLDATLEKLQNRAVRAFNGMNLSLGGQPYRAADYAGVEEFSRQVGPEQLWSMAPRLGQTISEVESRRDEVGARVARYATEAPPDTMAGATNPRALYQQYTAWTPGQIPGQPPTQEPGQPQAPGTGQGTGPSASSPNPPQPPQPGQNTSPQVTPVVELSRALSSALAQERAAPLSRTPGSTSAPAAEAESSPLSPAPAEQRTTSPQDTDRTATTFATHIASALTTAGGAAMMGGIRGAADAGGLSVAGDMVSGLVRPLMALLGEAAAPLAAVVGGVGLGLGLNNESAHLFGEERTLAGTLGARRGATPAAELSAAQNVGWGFNYHEADSVRAASQLGSMGVDNSQMASTLAAAMALARNSGMDLGQTTHLAGQYAQTGMSGNQILAQFTEMDQAARLTGVSVSRLTDGIKQLNQSAGLGALSVTGLAATQKMVGPELNVGPALAPAIGAQGSQAIQMQAMLGLNPQQFLTAQRHPEQLWDAYGRLAKQYDRGTYGTDVAESALQAAGLDLSSLKGPDAANVVNKLVTQGPHAAQTYYEKLQQQEAPKGKPTDTPADYLKAAVQHAQDITSAIDQARLKAEQIAADMANAARDAGTTRTELRQAPWTQQRQDQIITDAHRRGPVDQLAMVRAHPGDPSLLLGYEAITNGQDYANDPHAAGGMDASHSKEFGALSEYQLSQDRLNGAWIGGGPGKGAYMDQATFHATELAARRTGVPLAVLMAQEKQEATNSHGVIDPSIVSSDGGVGLGQFTPGPHNENLPTILQYLNQASHQLGQGPVTASNWQAAAKDPRIAAQAMADYDKATLSTKSAAGRWDHALAEYNAGPKGWDYTGHPGQGRDYGTGVYQSAEQIQHQLAITVTVQDQNGRRTGHTQTHHTVNTARKPVGQKSYGPQDHEPSAAGIPMLPGHLR